MVSSAKTKQPIETNQFIQINTHRYIEALLETRSKTYCFLLKLKMKLGKITSFLENKSINLSISRPSRGSCASLWRYRDEEMVCIFSTKNFLPRNTRTSGFLWLTRSRGRGKTGSRSKDPWLFASSRVNLSGFSYC